MTYCKYLVMAENNVVKAPFTRIHFKGQRGITPTNSITVKVVHYRKYTVTCVFINLRILYILHCQYKNQLDTHLNYHHFSVL